MCIFVGLCIDGKHIRLNYVEVPTYECTLHLAIHLERLSMHGAA